MNIGSPWPGSKMNGILAAANCAACSIIACRPSGATMPSATLSAGVVDPVEVGILHCAGMKRRDLIVIEIGRDEGLRGEGLVDDLDVLDADAQRREALAVRPEIVTRGRHGQARHRRASCRL